MAEFRQTGEFIDYTPGTAVAAGDVVVVTDRVFVAPLAIAANNVGSLQTCGVWKLAKKSGEAFTQGQKIYWDDTNDELTSTASTHKVAGYAAKAAASADTTAEVLLGVG